MRIWLALAALNGLVAVAFGAAGSHILSGQLEAADLARVRLAADYQLFHALALLGVAALAERRGNLRLFLAGLCFALGIAGFAGGLYARALAGIAAGPIVPIGGSLLMLGWFWLFAAAFGHRR
ncbi:MAG: DUF423 domain-containing protein [Magnetospirillum sp.]|jgi:uncharacterized membrane protein YgdD (TMEM256/DUF423 family)|nr:DUF423 domain-containing protein [Magnetospirillum sp.]